MSSSRAHDRTETEIADALSEVEAEIRNTGLELREYQLDLARELILNILNKQDSYLNLEYGLGKTLLAHIISIALKRSFSRSFKKILYLSPRVSINDQFYGRSRSLSKQRVLLVDRKLASDCSRLRGYFRAYEYIVATPWILDRRLFCIGEELQHVTLCILDEIDMVTAKEWVGRSKVRYHLECRRLLDRLEESGTTFLGLTAVRLNSRQKDFWIEDRGFELVTSKSPSRLKYLPQTEIRIHSVVDSAVTMADKAYQDRLRLLMKGISQQIGDHAETDLVEKISRSKVGAAVLLPKGRELVIWDELKQDCLAVLRLLANIRHLYDDCTTGQSFAPSSGCSFEPRAKANELKSILGEYVSAHKIGIVFSGLHTTCDGLAILLRDGIGCRISVVHGGVEREAAKQRIEGFKHGTFDILVMTPEFGGRGLDFPEADYVVLYHVERSVSTLGQNVGRIRSTKAHLKTAHILCYINTKEAEMASSLIEAISKSKDRRSVPEFVIA